MAYLYPCVCGRQYAVAATFAGSQFGCTCGTELDIPKLSLLSMLEIVPEPENKTIEPIDSRKLSYENEEYVLIKFPVAYDSFTQTRSKAKLLELLEEYHLHDYEKEQTYDTMDKCIRRHRYRLGWQGILIGMVSTPVLAAGLIFMLLFFRKFHFIVLCVSGLLAVLFLFFKGWYSLILSKMPNNP